jgi:hypothetical protein
MQNRAATPKSPHPVLPCAESPHRHMCRFLHNHASTSPFYLMSGPPWLTASNCPDGRHPAISQLRLGRICVIDGPQTCGARADRRRNRDGRSNGDGEPLPEHAMTGADRSALSPGNRDGGQMVPLHRCILVWCILVCKGQKNRNFHSSSAVTSSVWPVTYETSGDVKLSHTKSTSEFRSASQGLRVKAKQTHKSIAAAASSTVPGRARRINRYTFGSAPPDVVVGGFAPRIQRATFLPSISMATPSSLAAVNLSTIARSVLSGTSGDSKYHMLAA